MKKKVFIAIHYMEIGGAEKALLGLLESFNLQKYDIDLFVYKHQGELMEYIPRGVHLLAEDPYYACFEESCMRVFLKGKWFLLLTRVWARLLDMLINRHLPEPRISGWDEVGRCTVWALPSLKHLGEYDLAISFLNPHYVVRDKVRAKKKIAWIHTDYSAVNLNPARELPVWASYDRIISISPAVTKGFLSQFPSLKSKIRIVGNMLPAQLIKRQAAEYDVTSEMPGKIRLLSIGRFCLPKNFLGAVEIMAELCKLRNDVVWYIIGYGTMEDEIRAKIHQFHLEDQLVILGKKSNPYPYIKACDLYVQPSLYEGKAVTVLEAQFLGKPVAITRYPSSSDQLQEGVDGIIIPLHDPSKAAMELHLLLSNPARMENLAATCRSRDYSGRMNIQIIEQMLEESDFLHQGACC